MSEFNRYPYVSNDPTLGEAGFRPVLPLSLSHQQGFINVSGLLDTGASVNVMSYGVDCTRL
jgi:hypothetical protein